MSIDKMVREAAVRAAATGGKEACEPGSWVRANGKPKRASLFGKTMWQASDCKDMRVERDIKYAVLVLDQWLKKARVMR
jgi:hypothetical protein